jgi:pilus assembly protein CpaE
MGVSTDDMAASASEKKSLLGNFDIKSLLSKKSKVEPATAE